MTHTLIYTTINTLRAEAVEPALEPTEREALKDIFHIEGFGGREDEVDSAAEAEDLVIERIAWFRDCHDRHSAPIAACKECA